MALFIAVSGIIFEQLTLLLLNLKHKLFNFIDNFLTPVSNRT